ncbi:GTP pyrophosphokinase YjbM [compost metagenome]
MTNHENIIVSYRTNHTIYSSLEGMTCSLLSTLLSSQSLHIHSISSRTKSIESLSGKINRIGKSYKSIDDITDIVGIRITTYFSDELDKVSQLISSEFSVDEENSIDKRKSLAPDRFGYMSLHLVVSYKEDRIKLPEYSKFSGVKFEIQIRSILQHAWAEIEHDIGYKSTIEVPEKLKRKFSRLSGLLELADEEFVSIKNSISHYIEALPDRLSERPKDVTLDINSLKLFITTTPEVIKLEEDMAKVFNCSLRSSDDLILSQSLTLLAIMNIKTIDELKRKYDDLSKYIIPFLKVWLVKDGVSPDYDDVSRGISLLYLTYLNISITQDNNLALSVLRSAPFSDVDSLYIDIVATWNELNNTTKKS